MLRVTWEAILARMRIRVNRARSAFSLLSLSLLLLALPASSEAEDGSGERDRWVPALAISASTLFQGIEGSSDPGVTIGPRHPAPGDPIRPEDSDDDLMINPLVGIGLELMSPRLAPSSFLPRVFAHGGVAGAFGPKRDVARDEVIREFDVDDALVGNELTEDAVQGQGTRVRVNAEPLVVRAGAGIAWPFAFLEREFRVRMSAEYLREKIQVEGRTQRAVCLLPPSNTGECGSVDLDDFRQISFKRSRHKVYHGLGPGLEIEMDAGRLGAVVTSLSIGAQAYHFFGDRKVEFSERNEFNERMGYEFEKDAWAYRAGVAFRLRWVPE